MTNNPYHLNWIPDIDAYTGSIYLRILQALTEDIKSGKLRPGMKLPPQRLLAYTLGINLGTVHKAYALAVKKGFVSGETGRGSYIRTLTEANSNWPNENPYSRVIDFSDNFPCLIKDHKLLEHSLASLSQSPNLPMMFQYQQNSALSFHKECGCRWLDRLALPARPENLLVTNGALHGGFISLSVLAKPGDILLTEELTSQAILGAANLLKLRIKGIQMDKSGIIPESLEDLIKKERPAAVYLVPTNQNPTTAILSPSRRKRIAEILQKNNLPLIEDDVFGAMPQEPVPPISALIPDISFYTTSLSKSFAPALRIGYLKVPKQYMETALAVLRTTTWMSSPLMAELASQWIINGTGEKLLAYQRKEIKHRQELAKQMLSGFEISSNPSSLHLWLTLPKPWRDSLFTERLNKQDVAVIPAPHFMVERKRNIHAVRLCLGTTPEYSKVKEGLEIIKETLKSSPAYY